MTGLDIYYLHLVFSDDYVKISRLYCYGKLCLIASDGLTKHMPTSYHQKGCSNKKWRKN